MMAGAPPTSKRATFMKVSLSTPGAWRASTVSAMRALQREQRAIGLRLEHGDAVQLLGDIGEIVFLGRGVDDEEQRRLVRQPRDHEIVFDGALRRSAAARNAACLP